MSLDDILTRGKRAKELLDQGRLSKELEKKSLEASKAREKELVKVKRAFNKCLRGPSGVIVVKHLQDLCGWNVSPLTSNPQTFDLHPYAVINNAARQNVFRALKELVPPEVMMKVDYPHLNQEKDDE